MHDRVRRRRNRDQRERELIAYLHVDQGIEEAQWIEVTKWEVLVLL